MENIVIFYKLPLCIRGDIGKHKTGIIWIKLKDKDMHKGTVCKRAPKISLLR
ncbi:MAG: hypothetical protein ACRDA4_02445 [Filifactoraceae bacterium]